MLVLTRKRNEKIQIGNDVTITVLKVKGQSVQIGISAPRNVRVMRAELSDAGHEDAYDQVEEVLIGAEPLDGHPVAELADWSV